LNDEHAFAFDHQIDTDGVQVSVLLKRRKLRNCTLSGLKYVVSVDNELLYIDSKEALDIICRLNFERVWRGEKLITIVAIDPNVSQDFVSAGRGVMTADCQDMFGAEYEIDDKHIEKIRYTRPRRNKDTKQTYYKRCRKKMTDNYQYD